MSRTWEQLQELKEAALFNDDMKHALYWQNEQLMLKLNSATWHLKVIAEKGSNV
jgi:hypothetical protein